MYRYHWVEQMKLLQCCFLDSVEWIHFILLIVNLEDNCLHPGVRSSGFCLWRI
jgi:hypothetical protein